MNILLASSELYPFSKTGGLADMVGALARALAKEGHKVGVVTPLYKGITERFPAIKRMDWMLALPLGLHIVQGEIWFMESDSVAYYFVHQPFFYQRAALYQENGVDYPDNPERFIYFSKAVVNLARYLPWQPEMVHVHDWQTGLVPLLIRHQEYHEGWWNAARTCLTIHNLAFQGNFAAEKYPLTNLPLDYFHSEDVEFFHQLSCLKAGIVHADFITTVSPRYAREICTAEYGCGMEGLLKHRQGYIAGILNGAEYSEWKTQGNPHLSCSYSWRQMKGKQEIKKALQLEMGLPVNPEVPLFGNIGRLAEQKGIDILLEALQEVLEEPMQCVLLGRGTPEYERALLDLAEQYPEKLAVKIAHSEALAHRIEAATDFYLMPSRFEPCGLNQMYSLRYGSIPIVRRTGGLDNTVVDFDDSIINANGIKFSAYAAEDLLLAIRKALELYQVSDLLKHFRKNAMLTDFSWEKTAKHYLDIYELVLGQT